MTTSVASESSYGSLAPDYLVPQSRLSKVVSSAAFLRTSSVAIALLIWQLVGLHYSYVVSSPSAVYHAYSHIFVSEGLPAFGRTSQGLGIGFGLCILFGIPVGLLVGRSRLAALILEPYTVMLFSLPFVALFPVLILVEGTNLTFRVTCIILAGIFPVIINTARGVRLVSTDYLDVGRSLVAGRLRTIVSIVLPGSTRYIFAGIRVGFARAMIGTVVVELEAATGGIGYILHRYTEQFLLQNYFAIVIVLGFYALAITNIISFAERWTLEPWRRRRSLERLKNTAPYVAPTEIRSGSVTAWKRIGRYFQFLSLLVSLFSAKVGPKLRLRSVAWLVRILTLVALLVLWNWKA